MKRIAVVGASVAFGLLVGAAVVGYAQHDDRDRQSRQHDDRDRQDRPHDDHRAQPQHRDERRGPEDHRGAPPERRHEERDHHAEGPYRMEPEHDRGGWERHRANHFEAEHRSWRDRGGYRGYRVPDYDFHRRFGRTHFFRVYGLPYSEIGGYPRFQYDGLWFNLVEPYPEYWGTDWYQRDEMYVDYADGGYYLFNRRFPGQPGVALEISR